MSSQGGIGTRITQSSRMLRFETPLGADLLLVENANGSEQLSGLFSYDLELLLDLQKHLPSEVKAQDLIGRKVSLMVNLDPGERQISGIVKRFIEDHRDRRFQHYRAEIVPWAWLLTLKSNCRIFQNLTVPEIVQKIFDELQADYPDLVSFRNALTKQYVQWDYCVQYRETDWNFVSRLLEQEGIFYFFEHSENNHTLVLADANSIFQSVPDQDGKYRYAPEGTYDYHLDVVEHFSREHELRSGKWQLRDYHFELPSKTLEKTETTTTPVANNSALGLYDYPGRYTPPFNQPGMRLGEVDATGAQAVRSRMQEEETNYVLLNGSAFARDFMTGYYFELTEHREFSGKYIFVSLHHSMSQVPSYVSGDTLEKPYQNRFVCIPYSVAFRPRRCTPKPVVQGPQTAVVVGKQGEEIWVDKYGRVKVQFHWDRKGRKDENSSCWIRVSQPWAGKAWGAIWIPRIGQEVIVDFLEGDPDQPIITGRVYNANQTVPYDLPDNQTRSGFKSRSTKDGSAGNANEIRFEDKKGDEQIYIQAEKDLDLRVKNDAREFTGQSRHITVKKDLKETVEADKHLHIKGNYLQKVEGEMSLEIGNGHREQRGEVYSLDVPVEIHLKAGLSVIIEGGALVSLQVGASGVDVTPAGVVIRGPMTNIMQGAPGVPGMPAMTKSAKKADVADDGSGSGKAKQEGSDQDTSANTSGQDSSQDNTVKTDPDSQNKTKDDTSGQDSDGDISSDYEDDSGTGKSGGNA